MKIIYQLDDADPDEAQKIIAHAQAMDMMLAIDSFDCQLRDAAKYMNDDIAAKWRASLHYTLQEYGVRLT